MISSTANAGVLTSVQHSAAPLSRPGLLWVRLAHQTGAPSPKLMPSSAKPSGSANATIAANSGTRTRSRTRAASDSGTPALARCQFANDDETSVSRTASNGALERRGLGGGRHRLGRVEGGGAADAEERPLWRAAVRRGDAAQPGHADAGVHGGARRLQHAPRDPVHPANPHVDGRGARGQAEKGRRAVADRAKAAAPGSADAAVDPLGSQRAHARVVRPQKLAAMVEFERVWRWCVRGQHGVCGRVDRGRDARLGRTAPPWS